MLGDEKGKMPNIVLVVDMLKGFHNIGNLANPQTANIIHKVKKLLERKYKKGYTIIFLGDSHKENDKEFKIFPPHCIEGTEETKLIDELQPFLAYSNVKYIKKRRFSGLFNTVLEATLKRLKPQEIIIVGVCTDICILHTAADLLMRDYRVIVPKDCVQTFDAPEHKADKTNDWALTHMALLGAVITNSMEA